VAVRRPVREDEARILPAPPSLGGSLRAGAVDLYYNSWRVVPVNLVLGVGLVGVAILWAQLGALVAALIASVLAWPIAGLFRLGARATRGVGVSLGDALDPVRESPWRLLGIGFGFSAAVLVLATNLVGGLATGGLGPWVLATAAGWGLVAVVSFGFAFWPIAMDPSRASTPWRERARLAALLVLAHPGRVGALALVLTVLLALSTAVVALVLTVTPGFAALVACRFIVPASDRLEASLPGSER
jgi:hypothetical protein